MGSISRKLGRGSGCPHLNRPGVGTEALRPPGLYAPGRAARSPCHQISSEGHLARRVASGSGLRHTRYWRRSQAATFVDAVRAGESVRRRTFPLGLATAFALDARDVQREPGPPRGSRRSGVQSGPSRAVGSSRTVGGTDLAGRSEAGTKAGSQLLRSFRPAPPSQHRRRSVQHPAPLTETSGRGHAARFKWLPSSLGVGGVGLPAGDGSSFGGLAARRRTSFSCSSSRTRRRSSRFSVCSSGAGGCPRHDRPGPSSSSDTTPRSRSPR
jgi:hypothetical protein